MFLRRGASDGMNRSCCVRRLKTTNADHAFVSSVKPREPLGLPPARDTQLGAIIYEYKSTCASGHLIVIALLGLLLSALTVAWRADGVEPTLTVNVQHRKWLRALSRLKAKMQQDQAEAEEQAQVRKSRVRSVPGVVGVCVCVCSER